LVLLEPYFFLSIMSVNLSEFIYTEHNALTPEFCSHVIKKFEEDDRSVPGKVGQKETVRVDTSIKDSLDLNISYFDDWKNEDNVFFNSLSHHIDIYCNRTVNGHVYSTWNNPSDSGYQIQKTLPSAGYVWHTDDQHGDYVIENGVRWATYIWYLNDVKEGGYTEFVDGTRIQPETGKILIFPSTWTYIHRGYPPKSEIKYLVTGWMHAK